jgi:hypothetical protein
LKIVTAKVDVALSKALLASDVEKFLLGEIENLGKAMECELLRDPDLFFLRLTTSDHLFCRLQIRVLTARPRLGA